MNYNLLEAHLRFRIDTDIYMANIKAPIVEAGPRGDILHHMIALTPVN